MRKSGRAANVGNDGDRADFQALGRRVPGTAPEDEQTKPPLPQARDVALRRGSPMDRPEIVSKLPTATFAWHCVIRDHPDRWRLVQIARTATLEIGALREHAYP